MKKSTRKHTRFILYYIHTANLGVSTRVLHNRSVRRIEKEVFLSSACIPSFSVFLILSFSLVTIRLDALLTAYMDSRRNYGFSTKYQWF